MKLEPEHHPKGNREGAFRSENAISRRQFLVAAGAAGGALLLLPSVSGAAAMAPARDSVVLLWNDAFLQCVRESRLGPPMVARALAIAHTCIYDAWAAYDHRAVGTRLGGTLRRPPWERTLSNRVRAISFAAYRAAVDLFPGSTATVLDPLMRTLGYNGADSSTDTSTPTGIGNVAANAVLDVRHRDGANQLGDAIGGGLGVAYSDYTSYVPHNDPMDIRVPFDPTSVRDPNSWQPLRYVDGSGNVVTPPFVGAQWPRVTTFALVPGSLRSTSGPARFGSAGYIAQAHDLLDISARLTDEQKMIAEYWADGPRSELPPGHWNLFAQFVSRRDHHGVQSHGIERDVKLFFALTNAISDAGCCAWDNKRLGRALSGHEDDRWRRLVSLPADVVSNPALPGILVRAQQLQRGRGRDPQALQRERSVRCIGGHPGRELEDRARGRPLERRHAVVGDVLRRGESGRQVTALRWHSLRAGGPRRARDRADRRPHGLGKGSGVLGGNLDEIECSQVNAQ